MTPPRRSPRIETAASRGPFRYHPPINNDVESLENEDLPYGCGGFTSGLLDNMRWRPTSWLELHYPELTFGLSAKKPRRSECDYMMQLDRSRAWRTAKWRTA